MWVVFISALVIFFGLVHISVKDYTYRMFYYLMLVGFTIYSGIGILTEYESIKQNAYLYMLQFFLFIIAFFVGAHLVVKYRIHYYMKSLDTIASYKCISVIGLIYILTFIYRCVFSDVSLESLLNIQELFTNYNATDFATRVVRRNDVIYTIVTNQIASVTAPFYFIMLYNNRKKHIKFLILYLFPILLELLADGYLSRNKIAVYLVFIYLYLVQEKIISMRLAKIVAIIGIPIFLFIFAILANVRLGINKGDGFWTSIRDLVLSEVGYPQYYDYCVVKGEDISLLNFLFYIITICIPSQITNIINISTPNLAYSLTEAVTGLGYAQTNNYYILLPSVLGEALMLFGKYFAFLYGAIYGVISTWFLKILKEHRCLKYLMIYYLLDFFRQFRGGSQYVISTWETRIIPMMIIVFCIAYFTKRGDRSNGINHNSNI